MKVGDLVKDVTTNVHGIVIQIDPPGGVQGMAGIAVLGAHQTYYFPETRLEVINPIYKNSPED